MVAPLREPTGADAGAAAHGVGTPALMGFARQIRIIDDGDEEGQPSSGPGSRPGSRLSSRPSSRRDSETECMHGHRRSRSPAKSRITVLSTEDAAAELELRPAAAARAERYVLLLYITVGTAVSFGWNGLANSINNTQQMLFPESPALSGAAAAAFNNAVMVGAVLMLRLGALNGTALVGGLLGAGASALSFHGIAILGSAAGRAGDPQWADAPAAAAASPVVLLSCMAVMLGAFAAAALTAVFAYGAVDAFAATASTGASIGMGLSGLVSFLAWFFISRSVFDATTYRGIVAALRAFCVVQVGITAAAVYAASKILQERKRRVDGGGARAADGDGGGGRAAKNIAAASAGVAASGGVAAAGVAGAGFAAGAGVELQQLTRVESTPSDQQRRRRGRHSTAAGGGSGDPEFSESVTFLQSDPEGAGSGGSGGRDAVKTGRGIGGVAASVAAAVLGTTAATTPGTVGRTKSPYSAGEGGGSELEELVEGGSGPAGAGRSAAAGAGAAASDNGRGHRAAAAGGGGLASWAYVLRAARADIIALFLTMFLSFTFYPTVWPFAWTSNSPAVNDILVGVFQAGDFCGRFLPLYLPPVRRETISVIAYARLLFLPLGWAFSQFPNVREASPLLDFAAMAALAVSNGVVATLAAVDACQCVAGDEAKAKASSVGLVALLAGVAFGCAFSTVNPLK